MFVDAFRLPFAPFKTECVYLITASFFASWRHDFTDLKSPWPSLEPFQSLFLHFCLMVNRNAGLFQTNLYMLSFTHPSKKILMWDFLQFLLHWTGIQKLFLCDSLAIPEYFCNLDVKCPHRLSESPFITQVLKQGPSTQGRGNWFG